MIATIFILSLLNELSLSQEQPFVSFGLFGGRGGSPPENPQILSQQEINIGDLGQTQVFISEGKQQKSAYFYQFKPTFEDPFYQDYEMNFETFAFVYRRNYTEEQKGIRKRIYDENVQKINLHNSNLTRKYTMGINNFTDLGEQQFLQIYANLKTDISANRFLQSVQVQNQNLQDHESIDWTEEAGNIIHQGLCGSCYAIAPAETIAMIYTIYDKSIDNPYFPQLSRQQLVSCPEPYFQNGCEGGLMETCYDYVIKYGVTQDKFYEYNSRSGAAEACNDNIKTEGKKKRTITSYQSIQKGDCNELLTVLQRKPISVGIAAENFQFYKSGIFDSSNRDINHAVVLIGYSKEYKAYKIKNSWGESGENGFAWIDLNKNAGICERAVVPYIQQIQNGE